MKVVHLSNFDDGDGASIAAYRLHRGLLRLGHDSTMLVAEKRTEDPAVQLFQPLRDLFSRLRRRFRRERITAAWPATATLALPATSCSAMTAPRTAATYWSNYRPLM